MDKKAPQTQTKPKFSHLKALVYSGAGLGLVVLATQLYRPKLPPSFGE